MCAVAGRRSLSLLLGFVLFFLSFTSHVAFPVVRYGKHPDSVAAECGLPCGEKKTQWTKIFNSIKLNSVAWFMEEWRENITAWCDWCSTRSASWSYYKHDLGHIWAKSFFFFFFTPWSRKHRGCQYFNTSANGRNVASDHVKKTRSPVFLYDPKYSR